MQQTDAPQSGGASSKAPTPSANRSARRSALLGGVVLALLVSLFWWQKVLGGSGLKALDAYEYFYPSYAWLYGQLADGRLPLWNPYQLCGVPTLDTLQSGALYPLHGLYVLMPTPIAMAASGLLHLLLAAAGTYAFALRAGLGAWPALTAALLVATRGGQPGHVANPSMQEAGAWLAVGFIGVLAATRGRPLRGALWLAGATGMSLLAGFPQLSVYSAYAWGSTAIGLTIGGASTWRRSATATAAVVAGIALGAMLAAVVLLPALDLAAIGGRERGTLPLHLMLPFGRAGFETALRALGSVAASRPAVPGVLLTFGLAGVLLAALVPAARSTRRLGVVMLGLAGVAIIFALGPATPLFELLLRLPEVGTFRNPWRVLFVADFAIAIAAAVGLAALLARLEVRSAGPTGRVRVAQAVAVAAIAVVVLEVAIAPGNDRRLPYDADDPLLTPYHEPRPVLDALARRPDRVFTIFAGDMDDVSEKLASLFRVRSISDNEILTLARQREYFTWLYWGALEPSAVNARGYSQRIFYGHYSLLAPGIDPKGVAARDRLLDLAAARYVLVPRTAAAEAPVAAFLRASGARPVDASDRQLVALERPTALPRAYITHAVARAPDIADLLGAISDPAFDPRALSYVEPADAYEALPLIEPSGQNAVDERVEIIGDELDTVTLRARLRRAGLVVLADTYHPGWQAELDGEPVPILPTNHLFRGVVVPAGEHEIRFRYRPRSVALGASLSAVALAIFVAGLWWTRRSDDQAFS